MTEQLITATKQKRLTFYKGITITLALAIMAKFAAQLPLLHIVGQLVIAMILGMLWRSAGGTPNVGTAFSSKVLLRFGIILLGMRLDFQDIVQAGPKVFLIAVIHIVFTIAMIYALTKWLGGDEKIGILTACGTAICGAAAIAAIAPQVKASEEETTLGIATVAVLGTIFTIAYTLLYPILSLSANAYGVLAGGTLHEIAHVVAAAAPGGSVALDTAIIVKLTRVALLIPVALLIGIWWTRRDSVTNDAKHSVPIPWFIFGFLAMSGVNSLHIIPKGIVDLLITCAYLLMAMAMAGMGISVNIKAFQQKGSKVFLATLIGSLLLSMLGFTLLHVL
ncbi:YeiH family protein [Ectobacillus sp. JY-23]|uniref:YeiH family protein n=1 Tax=Ectobacillus sp. JY-23 TaxID=2933872 RepID=UPI001FF4EE10|nr:YeiH family protein [Ectobacillus sp. JY-23]UOY94085.1 YeiH family protein [Ectobacillus sp. JY-23]